MSSQPWPAIGHFIRPHVDNLRRTKKYLKISFLEINQFLEKNHSELNSLLSLDNYELKVTSGLEADFEEVSIKRNKFSSKPRTA